jgi:hypothetical protein
MSRQLYLQTVHLQTFDSKNNNNLLIRSQVRGVSDDRISTGVLVLIHSPH